MTRLRTFRTLEIPKRSPALNLCDYALWAEVNRRMRVQGQNMPVSNRESRAQFLDRLQRTALRLPASLLNASAKHMKVRCKRLVGAKGRLLWCSISGPSHHARHQRFLQFNNGFCNKTTVFATPQRFSQHLATVLAICDNGFRNIRQRFS